MVEPNRHGRLVLSFVTERHEMFRRERQLAIARRRPSRTLVAVGTLLITVGAALQARGPKDVPEPTPATTL